ncbi:anion exchange protein 4 [Empidonax traillii]|uniref:anion exchange protein 4 n=1 Tax=Empidonax traillii TaxID=164674 RepID=UPI000FFDB823|nr:anion exchange protein 4 [Empidonax traillii]
MPGAGGMALQEAGTCSQPRPDWSNPGAPSQALGCSIFPSRMAPAARRADAAPRQDGGDVSCPLLFIQLNQLLSTPEGMEWREMARWIKFEEKVEDGGERWSAPHIPALPLHSLFQLRTCLEKGTVLLDLDAASFKEIIDKVLPGHPEEAELQPALRERLAALLLLQPRHQPTKSLLQLLAELALSPCREKAKGSSEPGAQVSKTPLKEQLRNRFRKKIPPGAEAAHVAVGEVEFLEKPFTAFIRLRHGVSLGSLAEVALPSRFLFILLGPPKVKAYQEVGRAMATLLMDELFQRVAWQAEHREDLITGMETFLDELIVLPPGKWDPSARIPPPSSLPSLCRRWAEGAPQPLPTPLQGPGGASPGHPRSGEELERTGRLFGGLLRDIRRKAPWYGSDFSDALHPQCLSAVLYIYLATVTNAITFGGMLGDATANMQGVLESFLGTAFAGFIFCLFSGQPLTILSSTGPVLVFERLLFSFSQDYSLDYLEFRLWIGLWVAFFGVVLVATEASHLVRHFTRFTEEGFCALISLIFIYDSLKKMLSLADAFPVNWQYRLDNVTSYSCTCNLSSPGHSSAGNDTLLPSALLPPQPPTTPEGMSRTQCLDRGGHLLGSSCEYVPDVTLLSFLLFGGTFLSCAALKRFRSSRYFPAGVRKVVSDFAVILAILTACAVDAALGLETPKLLVPSELKPTNPARGWIIIPFGANPWWVCLVSVVPAVLVTILIFMDQQITAVILNRREYKLQHIPMPVLYGVFLHMGVAALNSIQLLERVRLLLIPAKHQPDLPFLRHVPLRRVHLFTVIQLLCLALLWVLKSTTAAIIFPVMLLALVGIRRGLERIFPPHDLEWLDGPPPGPGAAGTERRERPERGGGAQEPLIDVPADQLSRGEFRKRGGAERSDRLGVRSQGSMLGARDATLTDVPLSQ